MGIKVSLYKCYVDDVVVFPRHFNPGLFFDGVSEKLVFNPDHEYGKMEADLRTMCILRDIVNHLDDDIQTTIDAPSLHSNRRLPVLDLEVFVIKNQISFSFFKKPMSNPRVNLYRSAVSNRVKRDTLIQDGYRRMNNCSPDISDTEKFDILSQYMNSLRISGYFAPYRFNILKGILQRMTQIEADVKNGIRNRYRSREAILEHKKGKVGNFANTWFLKDDITNVLKVPCTPGSKLVNSIRSKCGQTRGPLGGRSKFVELGGTPLPLMFPNKDMFGGNYGCQFNTKCYIQEDQDCRISRAVYRIECKSCSDRGDPQYIYLGTTGFTVHKRMTEHIQKVRARSQKNALAKHLNLVHNNEDAEFVTTIVKGGIVYNLNRFILESVEIEKARTNPEIHVMNSRSEWGGKGLPRIRVEQ